MNRLAHVEPVKMAVAEAKGQGVLRICEYGHEGQNTLGDFVHQVSGAGTQTVELCSLDEFFHKKELSRLDFIKLDAEGAETKVLRGARQLLEKFKPVILLELLDPALRKQGSSADELVRLLVSMGYAIFDFSTETGLVVPSKSATHSDNVVAAPPGYAPG
jgi:FkbM family methyltransferase